LQLFCVLVEREEERKKQLFSATTFDLCHSWLVRKLNSLCSYEEELWDSKTVFGGRMSVFLFLHLSSVSLSFMSLSNDVRCQIVVTRILVEFFSVLGSDCSKSRFAGSFFWEREEEEECGKEKGYGLHNRVSFLQFVFKPCVLEL
jgi:hypothetical protein